ncbi:MAG TPA: cyclic nucleotide-binding domain-containing protein [Dokdonella sp.]|uniref:cyclic nucleotide-binding domain-containing protein n=1 Tax=Dokdonella sp. TaxID=2291710 RepID=UPI0025C3A222|nr:cyclic nucleotide-binding domain-containing protein [Dokdonella sp.]MBX3692693.1 helix-turn-helix domain-containing protein [Dokdonella sp.]MCW5568971.1 helix-turn-helix domain-containing protein [Dokdonella sp.]HNR91358.1 cyclic nucleotide-binding domain-containing protein [Dokdonella sp.]
MKAHTTGIIPFNEARSASCTQCAWQALCLPASLDGDNLERLDEVVRKRRPLRRGDVLYREGMRHPSLFVVRSGLLKTSTTLPDGDTQVLGFHLAGEIVGFDGLLDEPHHSSAEALEDSTVCEVPIGRLTEIAAHIPGLQQQVYRIMGREFSREQMHAVMMGRRQAMARLALFLHSLSERRRATGHDPVSLHLGMSRQELANYLGLVIETVSRLFSRLQALGVLEVERKNVRILDLAALENLAQGDDEAHASAQA